MNPNKKQIDHIIKLKESRNTKWIYDLFTKSNYTKARPDYTKYESTYKNHPYIGSTIKNGTLPYEKNIYSIELRNDYDL